MVRGYIANEVLRALKVTEETEIRRMGVDPRVER